MEQLMTIGGTEDSGYGYGKMKRAHTQTHGGDGNDSGGGGSDDDGTTIYECKNRPSSTCRFARNKTHSEPLKKYILDVFFKPVLLFYTSLRAKLILFG